MLEGENFFKFKPSNYYSTLLDLLSLRRGSGCKDKRHLIFSLLGAAQDNYGIEPGHSSSNTFDRVYANFTMRVIKSERSL